MRQFIKKGLVVSCQAMPDEPMYGSEFMAAMAKAAEQGGAVGIRANSAQDIAAIRKVTDLPVIGINKREIAGSNIYITPTLKDAQDVIDAGADIVAIDATKAVRPDGETLENTIKSIKVRGAQIMCDISTLEEGIRASQAGADFISTTLSGFTPYSAQQEEPDFMLVSELVRKISTPVVAEGRIWEPRQAVLALELGAAFVVIGTAITRPQLITRRFVEEIRKRKQIMS